MMSKKRIFSTPILAALIFLCFSCKQKEMYIYLLDDGDCTFYQKATYVLVQGDNLYLNTPVGLLGLNKLYRRKLTNKEQDSLEVLVKELNQQKIDSIYYKHLSQYCYMVDLSISFSNVSINTSVYDTILPNAISPLHNYLERLSTMDTSIKMVNPKIKYFEDIDIIDIVGSNKDTLRISNESRFLTWKNLVISKPSDFHKTDTVENVEYELIPDNAFDDDCQKTIERMGTTESGKLFYKLIGSKFFYLSNFENKVQPAKSLPN